MLEPNTILYLVDDVGALAAVGIVQGHHANVHVTFWDGILRGREELCRTLVLKLIDLCDLEFVWTQVPLEHKAVIAFTRRVGFRKVAVVNGMVTLQLDRRHQWEY